MDCKKLWRNPSTQPAYSILVNHSGYLDVYVDDRIRDEIWNKKCWWRMDDEWQIHGHLALQLSKDYFSIIQDRHWSDVSMPVYKPHSCSCQKQFLVNRRISSQSIKDKNQYLWGVSLYFVCMIGHCISKLLGCVIYILREIYCPSLMKEGQKYNIFLVWFPWCHKSYGKQKDTNVAPKHIFSYYQK